MQKIIIFAVAILTSMASCTDLDVVPNSKLTDETVYREKSEFLNGLSGVNSTLGIWSEVVFKAGTSADDMILPARGAIYKLFILILGRPIIVKWEPSIQVYQKLLLFQILI